MAISYANIQVTKVLTLRGNTIQNNRYTGLPGELTVDTQAKTIRIHDGVTPGGNVIQGAGGGASSYANANVKVYLTQFDGNIIPSANVTYTLGNITHQWRDLFVSNNTIYVGGVPLSIDASGNLTVNGNTIPTVAYVNTAVANVTVDLSSYALNANVTAANLGLKGYVDQANTIQSAQITAANVGIIGYVDQANTIQSAQVGAANLAITAANVGMKGYVDAAVNNIVIPVTYSNVNVAAYLTTFNYATTSDITTANLGLKGYVDQANTIQSAQITAANVGMKGYVDGQTYSNINVTSYLAAQTAKTIVGNVTIEGNLTVNGNVSYISVNNLVIGDNIINLADLNPADSLDIGFAGHRTPFGQPLQHTGLIRDASANQWRLFSNVVAAPGTTVDFTDAIYDDLKVGNVFGRLNLPDGSIVSDGVFTAATGSSVNLLSNNEYSQIRVDNANVEIYTSPNGSSQYQWTFVNSGILTLPSGGIISESTYFSADSIRLKPHGGTSTQYLEIAPTAVDGNHLHLMTGSSTELFLGDDNHYVKLANTGGVVVNTNDNLGNTAQWTFGINGNLTLPSNVSSINYANGVSILSGLGGSNYSNVQVATYLPTYSGNIANVRLGVSGVLTFPDGTTQTTAASGGGSNYGNANVASYLITNGYVNTNSAYGNGNVTAYTVSMGFTNYSNVNAKAYTESMGFRNYGNTNVIAYLNATGYNLYSNVNVASYLSTATINTTGNITAAWLSGNISVFGNVVGNSANVTIQAGNYTSVFDNQGNVRLPNAYVSGNVVSTYFIGNGSQLTGLPSSYSNVQVAAYLNATGYNLYSNANVASYLPLYGGDISARDITVSGNIALTGNILQINSAIFYGNTITGFSALYAGIPGYTPIPQVIAQFTADFNGYAQINSQNLGTGNQATSDFIATANNGTDSAYFVDFGIAGSGYDPSVAANNNAIGTALTPNDAYLYTAGNTAANGGGNLVIGVQTLNKNIRFFAGGVNANNVVLTIQGNGITTAGNVTGTYFVGSGQFLTGLPTAYSNVNVKAYAESMGYQNYGNVNVAAYTSGLTNYSNVNAQSYTESMGFKNYSNVNVAAYLNATGYNLYSNVNVIAYLAGNITAGNVTATYFTGNGAFLTGLASSYSNVQVATYLPTYTGVVTGSNVAVNGNVTAQYLFGNGALLTGIVAASSYSNVQVATYLPTYSGNIANIRLGVAGVLTFADGTTLATASAIGGSTYGNGNVASYLITNGYVNTNSAYANGNVASYLITNQYINANSAYGNGNVTSYLPTHSGNVGVNNLIGTTPNVTLVANSYSTTYDIYGNVAFGNAAYPVQIYATGSITTNSNITVGGMGVTMPARPAFRVYGSGINTTQTTGNVNLKGTTLTVDYNQGSYYNNTTGVFTAPIAGLYSTTLVARVANNNGLNQVAVLRNGNNIGANVVCFWETDTNAGTATHFGTSGTIKLNVGEWLSANILAGNISFDGNDSWTVTYLG